MNLRKSQSGFLIVELIIILAVVGIIGFVGYTVYNRQQDKTGSNNSQVANDVVSAPEIKTTNDLTKAEATLDQTDPDANNIDANQLDNQTVGF